MDVIAQITAIDSPTVSESTCICLVWVQKAEEVERRRGEQEQAKSHQESVSYLPCILDQRDSLLWIQVAHLTSLLAHEQFVLPKR